MTRFEGPPEIRPPETGQTRFPIDVAVVGAENGGRVESEEFRPALDWLRAACRVTCFRDADEFLGHLPTSGHVPQVVILACARPGAIGASPIERMHAALPLARLVGLLGSWCEGESRSGQPWPGVHRVYWHQFLHRVEPECAAVAFGLAGEWSLPRTATDLERISIIRDSFEEVLRAKMSGRARPVRAVLVGAADRCAFETLAEPLQRCGLDAVWFMPGAGNVAAEWLAGFWDDDGFISAENEDLRRFLEAIGGAPAVVVTGFPRVNCTAEYRKIGFRDVVSKPFGISELISTIR